MRKYQQIDVYIYQCVGGTGKCIAFDYVDNVVGKPLLRRSCEHIDGFPRR